MDPTSAEVEAFLAHYGVQGMKWGVRKDRGHEGERVKLRKLPKLDKKWAKQFEGVGGWVKINNLAANYLNGPNGQYAKLKNRPEYKGKIEKASENSPLYKKYLDDATLEVNKAWRKVAKDLGTNPSGTKKLGVQVDRESGLAYYKFVEVKHAATDQSDVVFVAELDSNGLFVALKTLDEGGEFQHYGVLGMKWGKRKAHPVTADAQQKLDVKTKVKQTKVGSVSNADLQAAIRRMQLEQDFKRLSINEKSGVTRWIASTLAEIGKKEVQAYAAKKIAVGVAKGLATGGIA